MSRVNVEYYTDLEPITDLKLRAFTKTGAVRKAFDEIEYINSLGFGSVKYIQVWFRGRKIYGNGNKVLFKERGKK